MFPKTKTVVCSIVLPPPQTTRVQHLTNMIMLVAQRQALEIRKSLSTASDLSLRIDRTVNPHGVARNLRWKLIQNIIRQDLEIHMVNMQDVGYAVHESERNIRVQLVQVRSRDAQTWK